MTTSTFSCLHAVLILPLLCEYGLADVVVQTNAGKLRGLKKVIAGEALFEFAGIPFAKPPIGTLRWSKPEKAEPWDGVKDATTYGPSCIQSFEMLDFRPLLPNKEISEDCLTLQVYVPRVLQSGPHLSVMVWIHGGGYNIGQAMMYDGTTLAMEGDVIVVTVNYRLGVFGFLSTEDSSAPGNYGLWDQRLAIQWVKENIENFGGNPQSITIFGESAGGGSVAMQSISPTNAGLFQRTIMQSGSMFSPWSFVHSPLKILLTVAQTAECASDVIDETAAEKAKIIECLRGIDATKLLEISTSVMFVNPETSDPTFLSIFAPTVDGEFLPDTPHNLLETQSPSLNIFNSIDLLAGTTTAEGVISCCSLYLFQQKYGFNMSEGISIHLLCDYIAPVISKEYFGGISSVSDAICKLYTNDNIRELDLASQGMRVCDALGDFHFVSPTVKALDIHSISKRTTYQYVFSHEAEFVFLSIYPPLMIYFIDYVTM